jgi:membrane-associated phospholipid phosphatase
MNAVKASRSKSSPSQGTQKLQLVPDEPPPRELPPPSVVRRLLVKLGPDLVILVGFSIVLLLLFAAYKAQLAYRDGSIVLPAIALVVVLVATFLFGPRATFVPRAQSVIRDWLPFMLLTMVYESLRNYTGLIRTVPIDPILDVLDRRIFGVSPTLWFQRLYHPLLTDYMAFAYTLYFLMPLAIILLLYWRKRRQEFRELALALVICFYSGFLLYLLFPAGPPRFYQPMMAIFDPPQLTSYFGIFEATTRAFDAANPIRVYASFPSLHCAIAMLALLYAYRFRNVFSRGWILPTIYAPLVVSLWISTVYLRHHWVVDVWAGWALGWACTELAPRICGVFQEMAEAEGKDTFV